MKFIVVALTYQTERINKMLEEKLVINKDGDYSVSKDYDEPMTDGTMTSAEYKLGGGVTMILVAEGWTADVSIDRALEEINKLIAWRKEMTILQFDDGTSIKVSSFSGGGSPEGVFGRFTLAMTDSKGETKLVKYAKLK